MQSKSTKDTSTKAEEHSDSGKFEYMFYWNSSDNQLDGSQSEIWNEYQSDIQEFLNKKYKEFLNGQDALVRLIPPLENYEVDFKAYLQINIKNKQLVRQIKIEERQPNNKDSNFSSSKEKKKRIIYDSYDIVFLFPCFPQVPNAEECYLINREKLKNEKVLFFIGFHAFKDRLENKKQTLLVTSTSDFQLLTQQGLHKNEKIIAFFIYQDNKTEIDVENKSNWSIQAITSSFDSITEKLSEYLNWKKMKFLNENVPIKAGHHFDCKEACIKYFYNQVIFNLFKSNKLSEQQSKQAFIDYCKKNYKKYNGSEENLKELILWLCRRKPFLNFGVF